MGIKFYRRYQSLKKLGSQETEGIEMGRSYVFAKIDGTNSQVWFDGENIHAGSRNRELGLTRETDNAGFCQFAVSDNRLKQFFLKHPDLRLYGEWLVPHSLKTYRDDAWRKFYIFDVVKEHEPENTANDNENFSYLPYEVYKPLLDEFGLDYIVPLGILKNASFDNYIHYLDKNGFLIKDGEGNGEGIVIKNYDYSNRYGRIIWAKIVTNEFKEKHAREMGAPEVERKMVEEAIAEEFLTEALIDKEMSKIINSTGGEWSNKYIPRLLETCFHCVVTEELWDAIKKHRNPTINFKALRNFCIGRVKNVKPELFQ